MRTKTLLLTAALVVAGVASSMAQSNVYSLNVVGYVNVPVTGGAGGKFYMLSNPFDDGSTNDINSVLSSFNNPSQASQLDGAAAYTFDSTSGYTESDYAGGVGWFSNAGFKPLAPGTGFFLFIPPTAPSATITFVGSVKLASTNTLKGTAAFNLVGSAYPASTNLVGLQMDWNNDITSGADHDGDALYRYNVATQGFNPEYDYAGGVGWFGPDGTVAGPVLNVAEGFFYYENQSTHTWVQAFTVN